jgi:hypothetical protein
MRIPKPAFTIRFGRTVFLNPSSANDNVYGTLGKR